MKSLSDRLDDAEIALRGVDALLNLHPGRLNADLESALHPPCQEQVRHSRPRIIPVAPPDLP